MQLIEGPNACAEAATALELQARHHEKQLCVMRRLFVEQLVVMLEAVCDDIWAQFAEAGLGPEAQAAAAEEEEEKEGELPRGSVEDVD